MDHIWIFYVVLCCTVVNCEYQISNGTIPSYLQAKFEDIEEMALPLKGSLQINMTLTKLAGTLLHSLDNLGNQFSIKLFGERNESALLRLNDNEMRISLRLLCGCLSCASIPVSMRLDTNSDVIVHCNDVKSFMPDLKVVKKNGNDETKQSVTLWLVNTPTFDNIHSNSEQLEGSIHSVKYNGKPISFDIHGTAIIDTHVNTCTDKACNGGVCHETHRKTPICDCTRVFGSGPLCENESQKHNRIYNHTFTFSQIKLSWNSDAQDILKLRNERINLEVKVEKETLVIQLNETDDRSLVKETLRNPYQKNENYILIISFGNEFRVELFNYTDKKISTQDLSKIAFHSLSLVSGNGVIDLAYKSKVADVKWEKWKLQEIPSKPIINGKDDTNSFAFTAQRSTGKSATDAHENGFNKNLLMVILVSAFTFTVVIFILFVVVMMFMFKRKPESGNRNSEINSYEQADSMKHKEIIGPFVGVVAANNETPKATANNEDMNNYDECNFEYCEMMQKNQYDEIRMSYDEIPQPTTERCIK